MYKYLGFGLLSLVAILMIPAQDVESITDASMYGIAILTVRDSADNILLTNTVHNIVVDEGTNVMLGYVFDEDTDIIGGAETASADAICLTDATGFTVANTITSVNFLTSGGGGLNGLDDDDGVTNDSCKAVTFTLTPQAITGTVVNFAAGNDNVPDGTTITGFAVCEIDVDLDGCTTGPLISVIATSVTLGTGETVDITYVLNLD